MAKDFFTLEEIKREEQTFSLNKYSGNYNLPSFTVVKGKRPFILTAPHSVITTTKIIETRNIEQAIKLAIIDDDHIAFQINHKIIIPALKDIDIKKIQFCGKKLTIKEIALLYGLNPYILRYYFYKTALEEAKEEENYTGAYTTFLANKTGCHLWVRNNNLEANASLDHQNPALMQYIKDHKILGHIDIHGARFFEDKSKNNFDIAIGTSRGSYIYNYEEFQRIITASYESYQIINIDFNTEFQATLNRTLCNQVHRHCGIMTTQFEINGEFRNPQKRPEEAMNMINGSIDCINNLVEEVEKGKIYGKIPRS